MTAFSSITAVAVIVTLLLILSPALSVNSHQPQAPTSRSPSTSGRRASLAPENNAAFSPSSAFISTLRSTVEELQKVMSLVSTFTGGGIAGGDLRLSSAVSDCLDLLDLSSQELDWSLSSSTAAAVSFSTTAGGERRPRHDLRSWLSAALGNQDTCRDGFKGTDGVVGSLIADSLDGITSLVADGLAQVDATAGDAPIAGSRRRRRMLPAGFPSWVGSGDRRRLLDPAVAAAADLVVAKDGSGNFTTVTAALAAAPVESERRFVVYVRKGVYVENVEVKKKMWNVMIVGDGIGATVISGNRSFVDGWTTFRSATVGVSGKGFIMRGATVENTAGPEKHQAVALRSDSDLSVYYGCEFRGYQDTLYAHSLRQFYRDCVVSGTVDFVFGDAAAVFQDCRLLVRLPLPSQKNSVTAQGRKDPNQNTGFSLQFCNVSAAPDLAAALLIGNASTPAPQTFLGRPWKEYSRTVVMQSYLGGLLRPEGWLAWDGEFALDTLFYGEFMNYGPGAEAAGRVRWPGFHAINSSAQAANFTVSLFIDGDLWLPSTGVKYTAGLDV